ncbi:MAG: tetratricopeptide repeat protein [Anaerolineaceae bacterium]|nr:tetratricopeptide repeat protein [Anaerolineaceae bacterium]
MGSADNSPDLLARLVHGRLAGRLHEMADAKLAWQRAASGETHTLLISGEPGVGKTRFVRELVLTAQAAGAGVLTGECYTEGSTPYAPMAQMIADLFNSSAPSGPPDPLSRVDINLQAEILINLAALVPALRLRFADRIPAQALDPQSAQQRIFESFVSICTALCAQAPLLLFFDDVHWADADTLFLLRYLTRRGRKLPMLIVMTCRQAELEITPPLQDLLLELNRERRATHIRLAPLQLEETRQLLADMFGKELSLEFLDGIYKQTEGNPFYLEEVCKALIEDGQFAYQDDRWHFPSIANLKIPQTVRAAIQARLQQLPVTTQDVLRMAAVLGGGFDFETLKLASRLDEEDLIAALESAVRAQIILEENPGRGSSGRFGFVHVLIPTTLRESIIHIRRQRLHLQAARAIETVRPDDFEALAYHFNEAGEIERARGYFKRAGDRAQLTAPGDAACFYQTALESWSPDEQVEKAEILSHLGYCLWVVDDVPGALSCFEEAYALFARLENRGQSGEMQHLIGRMYWEQANRRLAEQHYQQAITILEGGPETPELARAISSMSQIILLAPADVQAIAWGQRALEMAERLGVQDVAVHALNNIGTGYAQTGEFDKGIAILEESLRRSFAANLPLDACRAYFNLGIMLQKQCKYTSAKKVIQELLTYAGKVYAKNFSNSALWLLMWLDWITGQWDSALNYRSKMVEFTSNLYSIRSKRVFGMMDLDLGRSQDGLRELEESLPRALQAMDLQTSVAHLGQLVRAYAAVGQEPKMIETVAKILEFVIGKHNPSDDSIMPLLISCQELAKRTGSQAGEAANSCLSLLERYAQRYQTGDANAALAEARGCLAAQSSPQQASQYFRQSAADWESIDRPFDQARSLGSLGQALAAVGDTAAARSAFDQALKIYNTLADQLDPQNRASFLNSPLVQVVHPSSAASPPRQTHRSEIKGLTERELEVLKLLAQGLTNAQIAEKLVVSPLTINAHLRSIFNKLDVTTRTAAARQAIELGLV